MINSDSEKRNVNQSNAHPIFCWNQFDFFHAKTGWGLMPFIPAILFR
jgi:hypothetical protein